jgi:hypothetical protein
MKITPYNEDFYKPQIEGSYNSAVAYVNHLTKIFAPKSVADLGCGRGAWLKAFGEHGATDLFGFDGSWNDQEKMIDDNIKFNPTDLNKPIARPKKRFDLAISLEVAEHLNEESSTVFVQNLISLSDVVMFGAAYVGQGGTDHINEQLHTYWAEKFIKCGYVPYDLFRPAMWGNKQIEFYYQQNTFLYVKHTSDVNNKLRQAGYQPIENIEFMNCIHPKLYEIWVTKSRKPILNLFKWLLTQIVPKKLVPYAVQLKAMIFK